MADAPALQKAAADFAARSAVKAADKEHRRKINFNIGRYNAAVPAGKQQFAQLANARQWANLLKAESIENLHHHLLQFESAFQQRGGEVLWAADADEALRLIHRICTEAQCNSVVKSKSMVTEEIHLNQFLSEQAIESVETDLGEYIQQLDGESPYHIVTPAMHKSKEDVAKLFADRLGCEPNLSPQQLTQVARHTLRSKYATAEVGITGANFLIADTGSIAITENEGNARLCAALPQVHIVVAGIEKIIPSLQHLSLFWPLLSTFGTGQQVTVYNSIISGKRSPAETDGPQRMVVILLDNGRSKLLADVTSREALYCIRCGSCLNACPVYKNIGGHSYGTTYSGPIGKVITPWLRSMEQYKHLSQASSLCGNCTEVCPVNINLHHLLLHNRYEAVMQGHSPLGERLAWKAWKTASLNRPLMNAGNSRLKNFVVKQAFSAWNKHHAPLHFAQQSFNSWWKESDR